MASPFVVACTHCSSRLKLKDASFAGKKVRCPKCQEVFVAARAEAASAAVARKRAKPKDDFDFSGISEDDFETPGGDGEDDEFGALPPSPIVRRKTAAKSGGKKKKRASSGPGLGKIGLIAALVVAGLALVGGLGYGIYLIIQGFGGDDPGRLAWLPDDTEVIVEVRAADLWTSAALRPIVSGEIGTKIGETIRGQASVNVTDIDRIVFAGPAGPGKPLVVMYTKSPINRQTATEGAAESLYNGHTLYAKPQLGSAFFPDDTTMVMGPEDMVKSAIDRKGVCAAAERFDFLPDGHLVFATTNPVAATDLPRGSLPNDVNLQSLRRVSASLTCSADIEAEFAITCASESDATSFVDEFNRGKSQALEQFEAQRAQLQPNPFIDVAKIRAMMDSQKKILESASASASGDEISGSVTIPGKLIADAADAMTAFLPMILQQIEMQSGGGAAGAPSLGTEAPPVETIRPAPSPGSHGGGEHGSSIEAGPPPAGSAHGEGASIPAGAGAHGGGAPAAGNAHGESPPPAGAHGGGGAPQPGAHGGGAAPQTAGAHGGGGAPKAGAHGGGGAPQPGAHGGGGAPQGAGAHGGGAPRAGAHGGGAPQQGAGAHGGGAPPAGGGAHGQAPGQQQP